MVAPWVDARSAAEPTLFVRSLRSLRALDLSVAGCGVPAVLAAVGALTGLERLRFDVRGSSYESIEGRWGALHWQLGAALSGLARLEVLEVPWVSQHAAALEGALGRLSALRGLSVGSASCLGLGAARRLGALTRLQCRGYSHREQIEQLTALRSLEAPLHSLLLCAPLAGLTHLCVNADAGVGRALAHELARLPRLQLRSLDLRRVGLSGRSARALAREAARALPSLAELSCQTPLVDGDERVCGAALRGLCGLQLQSLQLVGCGRLQLGPPSELGGLTRLHAASSMLAPAAPARRQWLRWMRWMRWATRSSASNASNASPSRLASLELRLDHDDTAAGVVAALSGLDRLSSLSLTCFWPWCMRSSPLLLRMHAMRDALARLPALTSLALRGDESIVAALLTAAADAGLGERLERITLDVEGAPHPSPTAQCTVAQQLARMHALRLVSAHGLLTRADVDDLLARLPRLERVVA